MNNSFVTLWVGLSKVSNKINKWLIALLAPIVLPLLNPSLQQTLQWVHAQMGGPICHRTKILIYSKSCWDFGNYN
jgi:hypothetical protein